MSEQSTKSEAEWMSSLTPAQYRVTRQGATERPFSGAYVDCKTAGVYLCVCCDEALFASETKFDSRSGWPSFWQPIAESAVGDEAERLALEKVLADVNFNERPRGAADVAAELQQYKEKFGDLPGDDADDKPADAKPAGKKASAAK